MSIRLAVSTILATGLLGAVASAQGAAPATAPAGAPAAAPVAATPVAAAPSPDALAVYFDSGSAAIRKQDLAVLDKASRVYTEGKPTVMILTATTDGVGSPLRNLRLSQQRALVVLNQLVARGIPAERFQLLAKGVTEPSIPDPVGVAAPQDRRVDIAWR